MGSATHKGQPASTPYTFSGKHVGPGDEKAPLFLRSPSTKGSHKAAPKHRKPSRLGADALWGAEAGLGGLAMEALRKRVLPMMGSRLGHGGLGKPVEAVGLRSTEGIARTMSVLSPHQFPHSWA